MFSELVDIIVRRTNRPDFLDDIVGYLNETIRVVHSLEYFYRDIIEDRIYQASDYPEPQQTFVWERPKQFRAFVGIKYLANWANQKECYPKNIPPGIGQANQPNYYYGVGDKFVFYAQHGLPDIAVAYVTTPKLFQYYPEGSRPAIYDRSSETWKYLDSATGQYVASLNNEELESHYRASVSDWLLSDYSGMLCSGTITKVFSILDDPRNKVEYSNFKEALRYARTTERYESTGEVGYNR